MDFATVIFCKNRRLTLDSMSGKSLGSSSLQWFYSIPPKKLETGFQLKFGGVKNCHRCRCRKARGSGPRETFTAPLAAGMVKGPPLSPSGSTGGVSPGTSPTGTNVVLPHQWRLGDLGGGNLDVRAKVCLDFMLDLFFWFLGLDFTWNLLMWMNMYSYVCVFAKRTRV